MIDLNSLMIFARVVEATSFSEAARRLHMPLASVSRRVADLEDQLGVRLLERSTRMLRMTSIGADVFEYARRSLDLGDTVQRIVSDHHSSVSGCLHLSAPLSISESLLSPLVSGFRAAYPQIRIRGLISDRDLDPIADGVDLMFRIGPVKNCSMVSRRLLTYRHRLVASPDYLAKHEPPSTPRDLPSHPLITSFQPESATAWTFVHRLTNTREVITFTPHLSMNDFLGLTPALLAGEGIGELPPIVRPELLRQGRLIEVLPDWHLPACHLSLVHAGNRLIPRLARVFKEYAALSVTDLFPDLQEPVALGS